MPGNQDGTESDLSITEESNTPGSSQMRRKNKTTSNEDRERVIQANENGYTPSMIAEMLSMKRSTVYSILKKYFKTSEAEASKRGGIKPKKLKSAAVADIQSWIDEDCAISLKKLSQKIFERHSIQVSATTIAREIKNFNYTFKRIKLLPERRNTLNTVEIRKEYASAYNRCAQRLPQAAVVFIDEVGFNVCMRTSMGRSLKGTAAGKVVPQIRVRNISIVCAINRSGILYYMSRSKAINQQTFVQFIEELKEKMNGLVVGHSPLLIMDNVAFHKCTAVREARLDSQTIPTWKELRDELDRLSSLIYYEPRRREANLPRPDRAQPSSKPTRPSRVALSATMGNSQPSKDARPTYKGVSVLNGQEVTRRCYACDKLGHVGTLCPELRVRSALERVIRCCT
uniref:CCHC-type domain-containing protein n=1 Tax=Anopheles culicifacies TaxID=139723 RepID=A0A182MKK7_9DIPT